MMSRTVQCLVVLTLLVWQACAWAASIHADGHKPLPAVSSLSPRLSSHSPRLAQETTQEARLPIPTSQDIEAIKKVAQILVMLGEQLREARPWWRIETPSTVMSRQALRGLVNLSDSKSKTKLKVIPTILGDSPTSSPPPASHDITFPMVEDPPNDPVN